MSTSTGMGSSRIPWNKGRLTGQKPPLKLKEIWAIRVRLQLSPRVRDLAMFNLAIDSKLRACDLTVEDDRCDAEHQSDGVYVDLVHCGLSVSRPFFVLLDQRFPAPRRSTCF